MHDVPRESIGAHLGFNGLDGDEGEQDDLDKRLLGQLFLSSCALLIFSLLSDYARDVILSEDEMDVDVEDDDVSDMRYRASSVASSHSRYSNKKMSIMTNRRMDSSITSTRRRFFTRAF